MERAAVVCEAQLAQIRWPHGERMLSTSFVRHTRHFQLSCASSTLPRRLVASCMQSHVLSWALNLQRSMLNSARR